MLPLILALASAADFDHDYTAFDAFLDGAVSANGVDYAVLGARRDALGGVLSTMADAPVVSFTSDQQLAFWINAYNAATLSVILDEWPVASIRDLNDGNPWDARTFHIGGQDVTLNDMEHRRVRVLGDARVHAAVNCASKGCPPLSPDAFRAGAVQSQLDAAARRWVASNAMTRTDDGVAVSGIFDWYGADFTEWAAARGAEVVPQHAATLAFLDHFSATPGALSAVSPEAVTVAPYDWSVNAR